MAHYNTGFHTLVRILPRHEIDRLDRKYGQGDRRRKTSRYVQFIVMLMAQILGLKSLREIEQAQKSKQKRLYHLGVKSPISRSALSRMNDERSADFFKDVFQQMLHSCRAFAPGRAQRAYRRSRQPERRAVFPLQRRFMERLKASRDVPWNVSQKKQYMHESILSR